MLRLKRKLEKPEWYLKFILGSLPVHWYPEEIYLSFMDNAKIMPHKPDRPLVALALLLNCGILSANCKDFKHVKKFVRIWEIDELLEGIKK